ncbi:MAG: hypothetical protein OEQ25_14135, partial [Gammaproteobacteria bacterium]|nr:hypothetical protein [Gammaproteobacteria bacterium]
CLSRQLTFNHWMEAPACQPLRGIGTRQRSGEVHRADEDKDVTGHQGLAISSGGAFLRVPQAPGDA